MKKTTLTFFITMLACCWTVNASGHGMSLFASHDGKTIIGTAEYHAGVPVVDAEVIVTAGDKGDKSEWWKTRTDKQGNFTIDVKPHDTYLVAVDAGGGHLAETKVAGMAKDASTASNDQIVELCRKIHELEHTIRLRDILGGIGYIFGLVGIALYFKAKDRRCGNANQKT